MAGAEVLSNVKGAGGSHCIAFLCDEGYLLPTLVCAKQAAAHAPEGVDVIVFLDAEQIDEARRERLSRASGAQIKLVPAWLPKHLDEVIPAGFFTTHVNKSSLFRLFVGKLVDKPYDRILYMDGDMQVRGSLADLFATPMPKGNVAAVPDWIAIHSVDASLPWADDSRQYVTGLGLTPDQWGSYFNAGVIMAAPETWDELGAAALDYLVAHPEACRRHDQSALNHVCRGRITKLSPRWNFLRHFLPLEAYQTIDPAIVHFVGRRKPWHGAFKPWSRTEYLPYPAMVRALKGAGVAAPSRPGFVRRVAERAVLLTRHEYGDPVYRAAVNLALLNLAGLAVI